MAADTPQKRLAVIRFAQPWSGPGYPSASGSLNRAVNLHLYLAGSAVSFIAAWARYANVMIHEGLP